MNIMCLGLSFRHLLTWALSEATSTWTHSGLGFLCSQGEILISYILDLLYQSSTFLISSFLISFCFFFLKDFCYHVSNLQELFVAVWKPYFIANYYFTNVKYIFKVNVKNQSEVIYLFLGLSSSCLFPHLFCSCSCSRRAWNSWGTI